MFKKCLFLVLFAVWLNPNHAFSSSINGESYDEGTLAQFQVIGFSEDKRIFAFEVYGEIAEYGSFSKIYILDTEKNELLPGSPIGTEESELDFDRPRFQVRLNTWKKAAPLVEKYQADRAYAKVFAYKHCYRNQRQIQHSEIQIGGLHQRALRKCN